MRENRKRVELKDELRWGARCCEDLPGEALNLELLASVASASGGAEDCVFPQATRRSRTGKRLPSTRRGEFMRSGGCLDDGETTASDEHATYVVTEQKHTDECEDPAQDRRKRLKPCSGRHAPAPGSTRNRSGPAAGGAQQQDKGALEGFATFATKYKDVLQYADADEAEAVYSMVALTQAKDSPWAEGQGTTAPHDVKGELAAGDGGHGAAAAAAGHLQHPALDARSPAASHTEGGAAASDTSTKSAPAAKAAKVAAAAAAAVEGPMQLAMRPMMPGMLLAPMPMAAPRAAGGPAAAVAQQPGGGGPGPGGMSLPMVPPPFAFPGAIMAMPGLGPPGLTPFMPPWAYPPMFGAMPMPMPIGPNGQAVGSGPGAPGVPGVPGMGLMPLPPGVQLPPGMMLGMPPYMAAALQPGGSPAGVGAVPGPVMGMGVGMPVASLPPASLGPMAINLGGMQHVPAVPAVVAAAPAVPAPVAPAAAAAALGAARATPPPPPAAAAAAVLAATGMVVPSAAGPAGAAVGLVSGAAGAGKGLGLPIPEAAAEVTVKTGPAAAAAAAPLAAAAGGKGSTEGKSSLELEGVKRTPADSMQSSQQQVCEEGNGYPQGAASQLPPAAAAAVAAAAAPASATSAQPAAGHAAGPSAPAAAAAGGQEVAGGIAAAMEALDVGELKAWVLAHFCEDVYLMLLDVWRPESPRVRDAVRAWRQHVQQPRAAGGEPDYSAFLVSLFGLEQLLQVSMAAQQQRGAEGLPCSCSCAAHGGVARLQLAAAAVASAPPPTARVDG